MRSVIVGEIDYGDRGSVLAARGESCERLDLPMTEEIVRQVGDKYGRERF
jgi:hypothetical protein